MESILYGSTDYTDYTDYTDMEPSEHIHIQAVLSHLTIIPQIPLAHVTKHPVPDSSVKVRLL